MPKNWLVNITMNGGAVLQSLMVTTNGKDDDMYTAVEQAEIEVVRRGLAQAGTFEIVRIEKKA